MLPVWLKKIEHPNPIIIGLSFGGIVAQEIAAIISVERSHY